MSDPSVHDKDLMQDVADSVMDHLFGKNKETDVVDDKRSSDT